MTSCIVHQPHFLPWLGYFNKLANTDNFVVLDDVQYRDRYYQNRTLLKNVNGAYWFTLPVHKSRRSLISDVNILRDFDWQSELKEHLEYNYLKADSFAEVHQYICELLDKQTSRKLSEVTSSTTLSICEKLGFEIEVYRSSKLNIKGAPNEKLARICSRVNSNSIIFGQGNGLKYHGEVAFKQSGITIIQQDFLDKFIEFHKEFDWPPSNYSIVHYLYHLGFNATRQLILDLWHKDR